MPTCGPMPSVPRLRGAYMCSIVGGTVRLPRFDPLTSYDLKEADVFSLS